MQRREFLGAAGTAAVAGFGGCLGGGSGDGLPDTVTVGYPSPALPVYNYALYPALSSRLADRDVDLKLQEFNGYTPMAGALVQGDIEVGVLSLTTLVKAVNQNLPLVTPVGYTQEYDFALITGEGVEGWEDLRGKTVAVHSESSMSTVTGRLMVDERLGSPDACDWKYVLGTPSRLAAVKSGNVDAAVVFVSGALQAEADGYASVLGTPWDFDRLSEQTAAALVTAERTVEEDADLVEAIVDETLGGYEYLYGGDAGTVTDEALATGRYAEFDREVWVEAFEQVRQAEIWPRDGGLSAESLTAAQDVLVSTGQIGEEDRLSRDRLVADQFL